MSKKNENKTPPKPVCRACYCRFCTCNVDPKGFFQLSKQDLEDWYGDSK